MQDFGVGGRGRIWRGDLRFGTTQTCTSMIYAMSHKYPPRLGRENFSGLPTF